MTSATPDSAYAHAPTIVTSRIRVWLAGLATASIAALVGLPDGVAEPLQAVLAWSVVAAVAVLGVMAIAKGLERLLDCETS